ncbi:hypothetical protein WJX77_003602 [Trebouxia sp. C0004]
MIISVSNTAKNSNAEVWPCKRDSNVSFAGIAAQFPGRAHLAPANQFIQHTECCCRTHEFTHIDSVGHSTHLTYQAELRPEVVFLSKGKGWSTTQCEVAFAAPDVDAKNNIVSVAVLSGSAIQPDIWETFVVWV